MTRAMNPCEQFIYNRTHELARLPRDPIDYGTRLSSFFHELACAAATALGESASPLQLVDFDNVYHAKLAQIRHGLPHELRLTPYVTEPEPMPAPEDIPAYVANLTLQLDPPAIAEPRVYRRGGPRGQEVGPAFLPRDQLTAARTGLGWTLDQLGQKAGLSGSFIGTLESGKALGRLKHYQALRRALNLPVDGEPQ